MKYKFLIIILLILLQSCVGKDNIHSDKHISIDTINEKEAILKAEKFIRENGYTAYPADKEKLHYELGEHDINVDRIINRRTNSLNSKASYISEDTDSWNVGFLAITVNINKLDSNNLKTNLPGRAVIVNKDGKEIRIAHKDPLFLSWKYLKQ